MAGDDFAGLLRELKERSGLSYGALGKRLHMSGSTLHRYVNGEVVPVEFAPVERLARACRATPGELLELHRRWIRADALRGVKKGEESEEGAGKDGAVTDGTVKEEAVAENEGDGPGGEEGNEPAAPAPPTAPAVPDAPLVRDAPVAATAPAVPVPPRRRVPRVALYAATGVVAVSAAVALALNLLADPDEKEHHGPAGAVAQNSAPESEAATGSPSPSGSDTSSPSASASASVSASGSVSAAPSGPGAAGPSREAPDDGPLFTVSTTPYHWDVPCDHAFLVDRSPKNVPKPPPLQGAVGWAVPLKAVSANRQMAVLTVQGTGADTVVLNDLHVRVVSSGPPLDWNQYVMGNGCGGQVDTKAFDVSLDLGTPLATPIGGQRDFPYSVTKNDPEVFFVNAHTSGHDVSWYLELEWSSGGRHGIMRVDDHGRPFRTSASRDDSYYAYPLGGKGWELVEGG
ncbi:helix-turn-helix domain-containing protein [Streptomyces olivaceus]